MHDLKLCQKVLSMPSCKCHLHHVIYINALLTSNLMWIFLHVLCVKWTKWLILATLISILLGCGIQHVKG
jgi:hypothetical protein